MIFMPLRDTKFLKHLFIPFTPLRLYPKVEEASLFAPLRGATSDELFYYIT